MKVNGNSIPEKVVVLGNKTYLNLGIKDVSYTNEDGNEISLFEYEQFVFDKSVGKSVLDRAEKEYKLTNLVVTTSNGNKFDGNLDARVNMLSSIQSAELIGKTEEYWKLADNSVVLISVTELKEALTLAIQKVGKIVTGTNEGDVQ